MSHPRHAASRRRIVGKVLVASAAVTVGVAVVPVAANASGSAEGHRHAHAGIVPTLHKPAIGLPNPLAILTQLTYGGGNSGVGVTTGSPKIYLVFWGSQWGTSSTNAKGDTTLSNDPAGSASVVQEFFKGLGTGGEGW